MPAAVAAGPIDFGAGIGVRHAVLCFLKFTPHHQIEILFTMFLVTRRLEY
jgi:hypothetical protein